MVVIFVSFSINNLVLYLLFIKFSKFIPSQLFIVGIFLTIPFFTTPGTPIPMALILFPFSFFY